MNSHDNLRYSDNRVLTSLSVGVEKKIMIFGFQIFLVDLIACLVSIFLLIVTLKSAAQNLRKLDREEKALWSMTKDI